MPGLRRKLLKFLFQIAPTNKIRLYILKLLGYKIGERVSIAEGVIVIDNNYRKIFGIEVGNDVTIGPRAIFISVTAHHSIVRSWWKEGKIIIQNGVFIGAGAIILPGITIGENSTVGAGAVVTKDVAQNTIVAGVPARTINTL
jgi:maltose O-acetyltransferase